MILRIASACEKNYSAIADYVLNFESINVSKIADHVENHHQEPSNIFKLSIHFEHKK